MPVKNPQVTSEDPAGIAELRNLFAIVSEGKKVWEASFDAILDPVLVISKNFQIERANLSAAASVSLPIQDLIKKSCYQVFAKRNSPCPSCPMLLSHEEGVPKRQRLQPFSDERSFVANAFPIRGKNGEDSGLAVLQYHDVSGLRKLEEQLVQSEKMAALGLFAGGIAHDINNPLAGVLAFAQLALQNAEPGTQLHDDIKEIETSALRCKKILEDLLEIARPSHQAEKTFVDLGVLLARLLPNLKVQHQDFDYTLNLDLKPLSAVSVSTTKFEQVFTNILTNAFQALRPGGNIRVATYEDAAWVCVEISDDGEGISPENLNNIFDPYFTTKGQRGGSGLGLPICYNILREHGGHIEVSSRVNQGSTFRIYVPKGGIE